MRMQFLIPVFIFLSSIVLSFPLRATANCNFAFGPGQAPSGFTRVPPDTIYSKDLGYGFEKGAKIVAVQSGSAGFCTSDRPFFFSAAVPEGNYRVTVTLGDAQGESATTVKAELRRLMLDEIHTGAGQIVTRSFIVNVRTPKIAGGGQVRLKAPRETTDEAWAWDDRLTLEFNGARPCLQAVEIAKVEVPTVFILGDSTVCDQSKEPYASWGQMLPRFFKPDIAVANHAESGETLASSAGAHRLEKVLSLMKNGDYLLIQFGHNDMKTKDPLGPQNYKARLKQWIHEARKRGGTALLITPMNRHSFQGETVTNSLGEYPRMVREAAQEEKVALIDLHAMSRTLYEALGSKGSIRLFKHDPGLDKFDATHHSPYGAYELAKCVALGIRRSGIDLAEHLVDDESAFDPSRPDAASDFHVPSSPDSTTRRPLGD